MASLVANYGSSSDSDTDFEADVPKGDSLATFPTSNPLGGPSDSDSEVSDSEDSSEVSDNTENENRKNKLFNKLPNPMARDEVEKLPSPLLGQISDATQTGSVFINPFQKAEDAKHSILEKHVKMTTYVDEDGGKRGKRKQKLNKKKLCYSFVKGKCRYGSKCKFSHDLTNSVKQDKQDTSPEVKTDEITSQYREYGNQSWQEAITSNVEDDDSYIVEANRKKRIGISDTLVPPKKAMKILEQQRANERPWTVNE